MTRGTIMTQPTHYEVLSLPKSLLDDTSTPDQTAQIVKRAYHRALLRHHPDKAVSAGASLSSLPPSASSSFPSRQTDWSKTAGVPKSSDCSAATTTTYTIDQIITAYTTLSTPSTKRSYDQSLQISNRHTGNGGDPAISSSFQTGIETIDLDDLSCTSSTSSEESSSWWWKSCRCGNPQGFRFGEADLEEAGDLGELIVGCQDCSLWLRVHFAVVEEDEGEGENGAL